MPTDVSRFRADLSAWAEENLRSFPWRSSDASLYEVFVAEFFLTQTPAENVAEVYPGFLERFPSLRAIRDAPEAELVATIEPLGFHNMRGQALKQIAAEHESLAETPGALQELPRVGPYVANASLCFAAERRLPIVDRNVVRVYQRVFDDSFPSGEVARMDFAWDALPDTGVGARTYNLALLDFGATVCRKQSPDCATCFASDYCAYAQGTATST